MMVILIVYFHRLYIYACLLFFHCVFYTCLLAVRWYGHPALPSASQPASSCPLILPDRHCRCSILLRGGPPLSNSSTTERSSGVAPLHLQPACPQLQLQQVITKVTPSHCPFFYSSDCKWFLIFKVSHCDFLNWWCSLATFYRHMPPHGQGGRQS
jgi:hypothetical protein